MFVDENGKYVSIYRERNERIKESLQPILAAFLQEKEMMMGAKKPPKLGYRFAKQIYLALAKFGQMNPVDFAALTYDDLNEAWFYYLELTAHYNLYFEIVDNQQLFCAYLGINSAQFRSLQSHDDENIRDLMGTINTAFIGLGFFAEESGDADSKAVSVRLKAKDEGHSLISAVEQKAIDSLGAPSEMEVQRRLRELGVKSLPPAD